MHCHCSRFLSVLSDYFTPLASFDATFVPSIQNMLTCAGVRLIEICNFEARQFRLFIVFMEDFEFAPSCAQFIQILSFFVLYVGKVENWAIKYSFFPLSSTEAFLPLSIVYI